MPLELIVAALISVYLVVLGLGHVLVIVAVYKCLREDYIGRGRRTATDPTIDTGAKRAASAVNFRGSPEPQHMHALGARWLVRSPPRKHRPRAAGGDSRNRRISA
jgi:hypothetical protein